jgi:hypothetical protein
VRVPVALTAGRAEKSAVLSLPVTWKSTVWPDSSVGPALIAVAQAVTDCGPSSSSTAWLAPFVNDGASFTGSTVTVTAAGAESTRPSFAVYVNESAPL